MINNDLLNSYNLKLQEILQEKAKEKEINEDDICCVARQRYINSYYLFAEKEINKLLKINSKIITTVRHYNDLYRALGKLNPGSFSKTIKSKLLFNSSHNFILPKGLII